MTPKEKAKELVEKFGFAIAHDITEDGYFTNVTSAKECAIICINEMIDFRNGLYVNEGSLVHRRLLNIKKEIENYDI